MAQTLYWIAHPTSTWPGTPTGAQLAAGLLSDGTTSAAFAGSETGFATSGTVTLDEATAIAAASAGISYTQAAVVFDDVAGTYSNVVVGTITTVMDAAITGVSAAAAVGAVAATGGASAAITGVEAAASVGLVEAEGGSNAPVLSAAFLFNIGTTTARPRVTIARP